MTGNGGPVSFEVDLDGLLLLVNRLKSIRKDIWQLGNAFPSDAAGGMGQDVVQQAIEEFPQMKARLHCG